MIGWKIHSQSYTVMDTQTQKPTLRHTHAPNTKTDTHPYQVTHKQTHSHSQTQTPTYTNRQIHRLTNGHKETHTQRQIQTHTLIPSHTWTTRNRHTEIHTRKLTTDTQKQAHLHKHNHNPRQSDLNNRNFSNLFPPVDVIFERPLSKTWKNILYTVQIVCLPRAHTFIYTQYTLNQRAYASWGNISRYLKF